MNMYNLFIMPALVLIFVSPLSVNAQDVESYTDAYVESGTIQIQVKSTSTTNVRPPVLREQLRLKAENIQNNEDARNKILNERIATTTRLEINDTRGDIRLRASTTLMERKDVRDDRREDIRDMKQENRILMKNASSSEDKREIKKEMHRDAFEIRKQAFIKQLGVSINNLKQIRTRISTRIDRAVQNGKDMNKAKEFLIVADAKISLAELAISGLVKFDAATSIATSTGTTTADSISLMKPREIGDAAIKAIKDAHKALVDVVRAIAHSLGSEKTATSTSTTIEATSTSSSDAI